MNVILSRVDSPALPFLFFLKILQVEERTGSATVSCALRPVLVRVSKCSAITGHKTGFNVATATAPESVTNTSRVHYRLLLGQTLEILLHEHRRQRPAI